MNRLYIVFLITILSLSMVACDNNPGNMQQMKTIQDSIFARYPNVASIAIHVYDDHSLSIALGSSHLYNADNSTRIKITQEIKAISLAIFGKESRIEKGAVLFTNNETNQEPKPPNAISVDMEYRN